MGILLPSASSINFPNTFAELHLLATNQLEYLGSIDAEVKEAITHADTLTTLIGGIDAYFASHAIDQQASSQIVDARGVLIEVRLYAQNKIEAFERDLRQS